MKNLIYLIFLSLLMISSATIYSQEKKAKKLTINIISVNNGVGLSKDMSILVNELTKLGHKVEAIDLDDRRDRERVDINIYVELVDDFFWDKADKNYLIPNPEWYKFPHEWISWFDMILCKTREAERIFKPRNGNTVFMSFTCIDKYDRSITKDYKTYLHLAGASIQKATFPLADLWSTKSHFPPLKIVKHRHGCDFPKVTNINPVCDYLSDSEIKRLQNLCGVHVCPSETEGFGHYIVEALSCGAVVLTTNGPPMNEFVSDPRCLIDVESVGNMLLANTYHISKEDLAKKIDHLLTLSPKELKAMGKKNRKFFLANDRFFKKRLAEIFGDASKK